MPDRFYNYCGAHFQMTEGMVAATSRNIRTVVISDEEYRKTVSDYSVVASREAVTDVLMHKGHSPPSWGMPG